MNQLKFRIEHDYFSFGSNYFNIRPYLSKPIFYKTKPNVWIQFKYVDRKAVKLIKNFENIFEETWRYGNYQ